MIDARHLIGSHDIVFITLDTLRYDVAAKAMAAGQTPNLQRALAGSVWERRHSPATFTYAAHHAFFAGFLPTPVSPGPHPRLFATRFAGSETTTDKTAVFDAPDIVGGLHQAGYHTICIGGVGFFNKQTPLGCVLPGIFAESHWSESMGVTDVNSTERQVQLSLERLRDLTGQRVFLFLNISALHQPNNIYLDPAVPDSPESQAAALAYVDEQLGPLFDFMRKRAPVFGVICSDHGTAYGEGGFHGHRLSHPVVLDVPYGEFYSDGEGVES